MIDETPTDKLPGATDFESRVLAALADIQYRLTNIETRLTAVEGRLTAVEDRLTNVEARLTSVEGRLTNLEERVSNVEERLTALEAKSYDTKPIWERALAEILELRQANVRMDVQLDRIESMTNQTRAEMLTLRADFKEVLHHKEPA